VEAIPREQARREIIRKMRHKFWKILSRFYTITRKKRQGKFARRKNGCIFRGKAYIIKSEENTAEIPGRSFMPVHKSQMHRLLRIAALLKENRYPNTETLVDEFRRIAWEENLPIECTRKTVLRDMKALREEFHCPLAFSREYNGYYLKHHGWDFIAPALLDENEMLAAVIGARVAEGIFPAPLKNRIRAAVDYLLRNNNPDFLDTANLASLDILSGLYATLDPKVFMAVFNGWQNRRCVRIVYSDYEGKDSMRIFEPQTLVFYDNSWYSKGFCHLKNAPRTFALQRIREAWLLTETFEPDAGIIRSVTPDDFLGFRRIKNVKLRISDHVRERLAAAPLHSNQEFGADHTVTIPAVTREVLFPFLLAQRGGAVLLAPEPLRREFKTELAAMLEAY